MVPTTSTSITLLLGDCLAVALMHKMSFSKERFKVFHPGGNIGQTLLLVKDIMITGNKLPTVSINKNIYDATKIIDQKKLGLVVIIEKNNVKGILTDGDTRRGIKYYSKNDPLKTYKVLTTNYLASGGDDMDFFKNCKTMFNTKLLLRDVIIKYIEELGENNIKINTQFDGRVQIIQ
jgi:hypothetical protein